MMRVEVNGKDIKLTGHVNRKILLDTNILVYAHIQDSHHHRSASSILIASLAGPLNAFVSYQNILEFFSVMTNPRRVLRPSPKISQVQDICKDLWQSKKLGKLFSRGNATIEAIRQSREKNLRGPQIFDCLLAVTAIQNKIDVIWTENVGDFDPFKETIEIENPLTEDWKTIALDSEDSEHKSS
jgi:predicted nucleic acid-binding protein